METKATAKKVMSAAAKAASMGASNRRVLKAIVFPTTEPAPPPTALTTVRKDSESGGGSAASKELPVDDILSTLSADGKIIEPPFDLLVLAMLQEHSTEMLPAVEAMEINIDGFGHKLVSRYAMANENDANAPPEADPDVKAEMIRFTNFFSNCALDESFVGIRRRMRRDLETIGNSYWEVIRSPITNAVQGFNHIPGYQIRLGRADEELTPYDKNVVELQADGTPEINTLALSKRFRKFVQAKVGFASRNFASARGYKLRWFKEYRDPRVMDYDTGDLYDPASETAKALVKSGRTASEVIHFKIYSARTPYGLPRYIGNLLTIFGDRAAQEINFITLKNNNIPSMAIMVSNGQLTEGTIKRIEEFVNTQIQGSENYSRMLLLEGEGQLEGEDTGHVKIEMKPLTSEQMRDEMFQKYQEGNGEKLRKCWRLPPIFLGIPGDYNRASADTARRLADEQVFKPERDEFDTQMNGILADMGCVHHTFQSKGPNITDDDAITKILMTAERCGGLSPAIARELVAEILGRPLPKIDKSKLDPDVPFSIQLAEKAKNEAFMKTGSPEVGSQVTALKSLTPGSLLGALVLHRDALEEELEKKILFGEPEPAKVIIKTGDTKEK